MLREFNAPQRDGNHFALLSDAREFLDRMLAAVAASEHYVLMEFYLVRSGVTAERFIAELCRAAARGIQVRIIFDALGARGLSASDRRRLRDAGVLLALYNRPAWRAPGRFFQRDHRKLLLVDGARAFTGGVGLTDDFSPDVLPMQHWQDCMLEMSGPVLLDWHRLFASTWRRCYRQALDIKARRPASTHPGTPGRVVSGPGLVPSPLGRSTHAHIAQARRRVWLATAYFWPSLRLLRALRRAARRGVDVRLILTGPHTDAPAVQRVSRLFYRRLLTSGVVIYEFQARFLHCKLALCDDWVSIGSSNLDRWGSLWNLEANQEIDSPAFAREVAGMCSDLCAQSAVLRRPEEVLNPWSAYLLRMLADIAFAWSDRQVRRFRRSMARARRPIRPIALTLPGDARPATDNAYAGKVQQVLRVSSHL